MKNLLPLQLQYSAIQLPLSSHEPANNAVIHAEEKTEHEINILSKEHLKLVEQIKQEKKSDLDSTR